MIDHVPDPNLDVFTHDGKLYDLTKVRILTRPASAFFLPISSLLWVLKHDTPQEHRVLNAKIRYPLLVAKWRGKWTVVDGLHRLERYRRRGITVIPVKEVTAAMLDATRVSQ
jgi:hypothetical protein